MVDANAASMRKRGLDVLVRVCQHASLWRAQQAAAVLSAHSDEASLDQLFVAGQRLVKVSHPAEFAQAGMQLLDAAGARGSTRAAMALAHHLDITRGDPEAQLRWYRVGAESDDEATRNDALLGYARAEARLGHGAEALQLLEQLVLRGSMDAQAELGIALWTGQLSQANRLRALVLLEQAAGAGNPLAQYCLAQILLENREPTVPCDPARAIQLLRLAAANGSARALYLLGVLHDQGRFLPKDLVCLMI